MCLAISHDDNWIIIRISVVVGGFTGTVGATIITEELVTFHEKLRVLYDTLKGEAKFTTLEQQLALTPHQQHQREYSAQRSSAGSCW